jgi:epoxyqueuosine reductase
VAPYELDARRCISYLTIEHRSEIGEELLRPVGAHLFGCDICQAVCPWNVRARFRSAEPLRPRPPLGELRLGTLDGLEAANWESLVAGTPLRRLSFSRFRRNLDIVAGNLQQPDEFEEER